MWLPNGRRVEMLMGSLNLLGRKRISRTSKLYVYQNVNGMCCVSHFRQFESSSSLQLELCSVLFGFGQQCATVLCAVRFWTVVCACNMCCPVLDSSVRLFCVLSGLGQYCATVMCAEYEIFYTPLRRCELNADCGHFCCCLSLQAQWSSCTEVRFFPRDGN